MALAAPDEHRAVPVDEDRVCTADGHLPVVVRFVVDDADEVERPVGADPRVLTVDVQRVAVPDGWEFSPLHLRRVAPRPREVRREPGQPGRPRPEDRLVPVPRPELVRSGGQDAARVADRTAVDDLARSGADAGVHRVPAVVPRDEPTFVCEGVNAPDPWPEFDLRGRLEAAVGREPGDVGGLPVVLSDGHGFPGRADPDAAGSARAVRVGELGSPHDRSRASRPIDAAWPAWRPDHRCDGHRVTRRCWSGHVVRARRTTRSTARRPSPASPPVTVPTPSHRDPRAGRRERRPVPNG